MPKYTLYIRDNCHDCGKVYDYLDERNIQHERKNLDLPETVPPIPVYAAPALFVDNDLAAYGIDIMPFLDRTYKAPVAEAKSAASGKKSFWQRLFGK